MRFFKQALLATAFGGVVTAFAAAQPAFSAEMAAAEAEKDKAKESYNAKGLPFGSFNLFPKVELEATHNDNIYKEKTGENDDWITTITPSLSLRSDWNNHSLRLDANTEIGRFRDRGANDYEDYDLRARGKLDASKALKITGEARHQWKHDDRGDDDVSSTAKAPVEHTERDLKLKAEYQPNRFGLTLNADHKNYDYDDNTNTDGSSTNNDDRDRDELVLTMKAGYEVQDGYEAYVKGAWNDRDYNDGTDDNGANRDSDGYNVQVGLAVDLSKLVRADLAAGYMSQDYTDASLKDASGWSANANISWYMTALTTVRATASRSVDETTTSSVSSTIGTNYGVGLDHEFRRNLKASADLKFNDTDYQGTSRNDDKMTASAKLDYKLNRNLYAGAKYQFEEKDSNENSNDYDQQQIMLTIGLQL